MIIIQFFCVCLQMLLKLCEQGSGFNVSTFIDLMTKRSYPHLRKGEFLKSVNTSSWLGLTHQTQCTSGKTGGTKLLQVGGETHPAV